MTLIRQADVVLSTGRTMVLTRRDDNTIRINMLDDEPHIPWLSLDDAAELATALLLLAGGQRPEGAS